MKQIRRGPERARSSRRGAVLITALVVVLLIASMSAMMLSLGTAAGKEVGAARDSARALLIAEAGVHDAMARFAASLEDETLKPSGGIANEAAPVTMATGSYWVDVVEDADTVTLTAYAVSGAQRRALEVVLSMPSGGVYASAIFSGNSSGDPTYSLDLGGVGVQADSVEGDVFSGGDVTLEGDAEVHGTIRAGGSIVGGVGEQGVSQPIPDIAGMNYEINHDIDVLAEFLGPDAEYKYDAAGGDAWQLPEENPAHIFRVNPSDRASDINSTVKNDFFLEDPYENVRVDSNQNGKDAYKITLSGTMGNPGPPGTDKVYFIDGNLWIHNKKTYSFKFYNQGNEETRVTFVVKGNVYFSDNLFYLNKNKDGVAFIAMKDDDVADSGNIYFGDPTFGTLEHMSAFMYAENDFYDNNLDASGSATVTVVGNMSAGNQVAIERDWGSEHSKLTVEFDDRIVAGELDLPGLPTQSSGGGKYEVLSWREVSADPVTP